MLRSLKCIPLHYHEFLVRFGWGPTQLLRITANHGSQFDQSFLILIVSLVPFRTQQKCLEMSPHQFLNYSLEFNWRDSYSSSAQALRGSSTQNVTCAGVWQRLLILLLRVRLAVLYKYNCKNTHLMRSWRLSIFKMNI